MNETHFHPYSKQQEQVRVPAGVRQFAALRAAVVKNTVFWILTPCMLANIYQRPDILKTARSPETSILSTVMYGVEFHKSTYLTF